MSWTCPGLVLYLSWTCPGLVLDLSCTCPILVLDFSWTCPGVREVQIAAQHTDNPRRDRLQADQIWRSRASIWESRACLGRRPCAYLGKSTSAPPSIFISKPPARTHDRTARRARLSPLHTHRSITRTGSCTLNAVSLLFARRVESRGSPGPCPTALVCVEKLTFSLA